jgi:hypothetical protein
MPAVIVCTVRCMLDGGRADTNGAGCSSAVPDHGPRAMLAGNLSGANVIGILLDIKFRCEITTPILAARRTLRRKYQSIAAPGRVSPGRPCSTTAPCATRYPSCSSMSRWVVVHDALQLARRTAGSPRSRVMPSNGSRCRAETSSDPHASRRRRETNPRPGGTSHGRAARSAAALRGW